jgi:putative endonuclease
MLQLSWRLAMATEIGRRAEQLGANFLKTQGYKVLAQNWRTRWCEIDIVAERAGIIHIIEVKYRQTSDFGGPASYITPVKLGQLKRAAQLYQAEVGHELAIQIDALSVWGDISDPGLELIENITL